jgi:hypothetical protein
VLDPITGHHCDLEPTPDGRGVQTRVPKEGETQSFWLVDPATFEVRPILMRRIGVEYTWEAADPKERRRYLYQDIFENEETARRVADELRARE